jgi:hypothetical protein
MKGGEKLLYKIVKTSERVAHGVAGVLLLIAAMTMLSVCVPALRDNAFAHLLARMVWRLLTGRFTG